MDNILEWFNDLFNLDSLSIYLAGWILFLARIQKLGFSSKEEKIPQQSSVHQGVLCSAACSTLVILGLLRAPRKPDFLPCHLHSASEGICSSLCSVWAIRQLILAPSTAPSIWIWAAFSLWRQPLSSSPSPYSSLGHQWSESDQRASAAAQHQQTRKQCFPSPCPW